MARAPRPAVGYDPDRWARRWGTRLGLALLVGAILPISQEDRGPVGWMWTSYRVWPWNAARDAPSGALSWFWIPFALGAVALAISRWTHAGPRAVLLFAVALLAVVASVLLLPRAAAWAEPSSYIGQRPDPGLLSFLTLNASALAIAVGNHARRSFPRSEAARGVAALGGALTIAWFLVPVWDGRALASYLVTGREWRDNAPVDLAFAGILAYAILGVESLSKGGSVHRRCRALSAVARAYLLTGLLLAVGLELTDAPQRHGAEFLWALVGSVKAPLLGLGHMLLVAVAAAAWMDATLARRSTPQPLDSARVDQVFG